MNRTQKFLYNSISTAFQQVVIMIAGFITPRIMLYSYGSEINGLTSSINQFIVYFSLVEAGIAGAAIYALYKPLADNNYKEINAIVSATKGFYMLSGYIFSVLTICLAIIYPIFIKTSKLTLLNVGLLVLILGVSGALDFFTMAKYRVLLSADQKIYVISLVSTISTIVKTIIIVILARYRFNINILFSVSLLSVFIRSFIFRVYVNSKYKYIDYNEKPNNAALNKRWDAFYLQILVSVQTGVPIVLATIFTNLKMVSVYSIFNMVIGGINGVLGIFVSGLSASFGDVIARKEQITLQKTYKEFEFIYYSILCLIYSITFVTIMPFIRIYTKGITDMNYNLPLIGFLFVINGLLYNLKTPQGMLVISAGLFKETRMQTTVQAIIIILFGIILAPFMGLYGILIGSIISNLYRDIDLLIFIPHNVTKLRVRESLLRMIRLIVSSIIICLPFILIKYNPTNYIEWVIFSFIVGTYSLLILIVVSIIFERKEIKNISKRILNMRRI